MTENKYTTLAQYFVDSRTGVSGAYALTQNNTESWGTGFNAAYKDNVAMTNSGNNVSSNVKGTFKFTTAAVGTDDINIFSSNVADQFLQGNLYNVKISNGGTVVANYDLTTQFAGSSITDESGNGKTATLNGNANWISDLCVYASIPGGTYASAKSVVLNTNRTATVYYTTDGSTPTTSSTVYSGVIAVNSNTTLKYFAVGSGGTTTTPVYTETYTFQQVSITSGLAHKFDFSKGTGSQTSIVDTVGGQFTLNLTNFKFDGTDGWTGVGLKTNATNGGYAISPDMSKFAVTNGTSTTLIYFMEFNTSYGQMYLSTSNVLGNLNLGGADSSTWGRFNIGQVSVGAGDVHAMSQYRDNIGGTGSTISIMEDNATTTASDFFMNTPAVIAMVLDATAKTASLYFNGKLKKTISINALPKYDNIIIQNVPQIAHSLYVYNRALTASEITSVSSDILK